MQRMFRSHLNSALWFALVAACVSISAAASRAEVSATLDVDVSKPGPTIPANFFGLMTEEINHSYDGGLDAELIQNRTFQDPRPDGRGRGRGGAGGGGGGSGVAGGSRVPIHWSVVGSGKISTDDVNPVNAALPISLRLELTG